MKYLYALIDRPAQGHPSSFLVNGHRIELLTVGPAWAAIEELAASPELSEESLRSQHRIAVLLARRFDAILPARFGAIVDTLELERLVAARQRRLRSAFDTVRGRAQMTVRLFGPVVKGPGSPSRPRTGTFYLQTRWRAARVQLPVLGAAIQRAVGPMVERERVETGRGHVRATLHHLIRRDRAKEYRSLVRQAVAAQPRVDDIVISGPWPPFAFAPSLSP